MNLLHNTFLSLSALFLISNNTVLAQTSRSTITTSASFISPKSPTIVSNLFTPNSPTTTFQAREQAISTCYGYCNTSRSSTPLHAKKRNKGEGPTKSPRGAKHKSTGPPKLKNGKIQVQMTKHVAGTGNIGDVILVAPAFYENKLKKTQSARPVTDEEVEQQKSEQKQQQQERDAMALKAKEQLENMKIVFEKKAGPEGHLFGGIKPKDVLLECKSKFPKKTKAMEGKAVKVLELLDEEGKDIGHDIKELGVYIATISLGADVQAKVAITVKAS